MNPREKDAALTGEYRKRTVTVGRDLPVAPFTTTHLAFCPHFEGPPDLGFPLDLTVVDRLSKALTPDGRPVPESQGTMRTRDLRRLDWVSPQTQTQDRDGRRVFKGSLRAHVHTHTHAHTHKHSYPHGNPIRSRTPQEKPQCVGFS